MKRQEEINYYRRQTGRLLIAFGSLIMAAVLLVNIVDYLKSKSAVHEFEEAKQTIVMNDAATGNVQAEIIVSKTEEDKEEQVDLAAVLGVLRIPKIDLEEAVREGSTSSVISSALGHVENTALPGQQGNCAIAGHRNYVFGRYFNRLNEMEAGDIVEIETLDGTYTYTVTESFVVEPEEVSVLDQTEGYDLTLITCTPLFVGTHRLIIRAESTNRCINKDNTLQIILYTV